MSEEAEIISAMTALLMECPELAELEGRLSQFNIFRVLRIDEAEIRHSNMLAWLLDPDESHGLGDRFLRRWLMEVANEMTPRSTDAATSQNTLNRTLSPIEVDACDIDYVDVAREKNRIDFQISIETGEGRQWIICVENKVNATQSEGQLERYRKLIETKYRSAEKVLFVFLTKNAEEPQDPSWTVSTYKTVKNALETCLQERAGALRHEPRLLMRQYLDLLSEDFVDDSKSIILARKIYGQHKKAIDFIYESRQDAVLNMSTLMLDIVNKTAPKRNVLPLISSRGYVRFLPQEWNVSQNRCGQAWGADSPYVLCEICFETTEVELQITVGQAPDEWTDLVWARAKEAPFKQWPKRRSRYCKPYRAKTDLKVAELQKLATEDANKRLQEWLDEELKSREFRVAIEAIRDLLPHLKAC